MEWNSLMQLEKAIDLQFYLKTLVPIILTTIFIFIQTVVDKMWISRNDIANKFNHFMFVLISYAGMYYLVIWVLFKEILPFSQLGIPFIAISVGQFFILFLINSVFSETKKLNGFIVWIFSITTWALFWIFGKI